MKNGVSVCMIVRNEEKNIRKALESVRYIASEIVLVDTGSNDRTKDIAEEYNAAIFDYSWNDDFAEVRNFSISKATYSHILILDADEKLSEELPVKEAYSDPDPNTGGWIVNIKSINKSKNSSSSFNSTSIRFFRNNSLFRFENKVHEQIANSILQNNFKVKHSNIRLIHTGYDLSSEEMLQKNLRNLKLLNKSIAEKESSFMRFQRAKTYHALNDLNKAEKDIQVAVNTASKQGSVYPMALNYGALIAKEIGNSNVAIIRAKDSLNIIPNQFFANNILADIYFTKAQFRQAMSHYRNALKAKYTQDPQAMVIGDLYLNDSEIFFKIARCFTKLSNYKLAQEYYEKSIEADKSLINSFIGLAHALFHQKKFKEAYTLILEAEQNNKDNPSLNKYKDLVSKHLTKDIIEILNHESITLEKPLISLSMIVKNEEKMLQGCFDSVKGIVDEIIVVDTGSEDRTVEIAEANGAKVYHFPWIDDFSAARNEALKYCTGEWILYLDADERLVLNNGLDLKELVKNTDLNIGGYFCMISSRHNVGLENSQTHKGGYPRLFRNMGYPNIKFTGRVHEQITPAIFDMGMKIEFSDVQVDHLGYDQSREVMEKKIERNYRLLIQHVKEEPLNGYAWYQLGQTLAHMKMANEAEQAIRFAIESGKLSNSIYASAAAALAQLCGNKRKFEEALSWADKSLEKVPEQAYALYLKAYCHLYLHHFDKAEDLFNQVKNKTKAIKGIPRTGFDIEIHDEFIQKGFEELDRLKKEEAFKSKFK